MDWVVVKRYLREEGDDKKYYLSRLFLNVVREEEGDDIDKSSLKDYSVSEMCKLSYFKDGAQIFGYVCHDWICFHDLDGGGQFVVYNITTKEVTKLPPYNSRRLENPDWTIVYRSSGMGYDPKSDDYKVVRSFMEYHQDGYTFPPAELYSLKTGSLKSIPIAESASCVGSTCPGVYVGGKYYWERGGRVECFDFTDETFSVIPEPPKPKGYQLPDYYVFLVQCRGHLGIILCLAALEHCELWMRPSSRSSPKLLSESWGIRSPSSSSTSCFSNKRKTFQVWVWKEDSSSWTKLYEAALHHVVKPLCLIDGRISLFQGETRDLKCDLVFYDWITKEMKKFNISDYPGHMQVFTRIELPPDASPTPYTEEEIKTDKNASLALKKKKKTGTKTGTKTTKSKTMCVGQNASSTAKRRRSRKKAFKEEGVSGGGLGEEKSF